MVVRLPVCGVLQIAMEFGTTSRLAQGTAAAVQFGVDPQDALDKISKLQERLSTLEQVRTAGEHCCSSGFAPNMTFAGIGTS